MKIISLILILISLVGCKTSHTKCDAYSFDDSDINKNNIESHKKFTSYETIKLN